MLGGPAVPLADEAAVARPDRLQMNGILGNAFPAPGGRSAADHGRMCCAMRVAKKYHKERHEKEKLESEQDQHPDASLLRDIAWGKTLSVRSVGRAFGCSPQKVGRSLSASRGCTSRRNCFSCRTSCVSTLAGVGKLLMKYKSVRVGCRCDVRKRGSVVIVTCALRLLRA